MSIADGVLSDLTWMVVCGGCDTVYTVQACGPNPNGGLHNVYERMQGQTEGVITHSVMTGRRSK